MATDQTLSTHADLRTRYRDASPNSVAKVIDHLDDHCADFLAASPMVILSTADVDGRCDGSPKGGEPGFARPIDRHRLGWADSSGNNRLDSFENIVANPHVAALFLVPGVEETLRVNGRAHLSTDSELCASFPLRGRPAKVVVVIEVEEAYLHCSKAFRRASLWQPDSWLSLDERPDAVCMLRDHIGLDTPLDDLKAAYVQDADDTLWKPGGSPSTNADR